MRAIRFRVWNKQNKTMYPSAPLYKCNFTTSNFDEYVVMQYTGLKDGYDKEIYEGDIILSIQSNIKYVVEFNKLEAAFLAVAKASYIPSRGWKEAEVMGNIYENPELIKP